MTQNYNYRGLFMDKGSVSGFFPDPNPDPGDPKRPDTTGSGSGSATLLDTFEYIHFADF